jgi:hypothetical protein
MKKLIILLVFAAFITQVQAQKLMEKDVPASVTTAFAKEFPNMKDVDWSKDGSNYEASYDADKVDKSVTYDAYGKMIESEVGIMESALPAPVMEYVKKNHKGHKIKESARITEANGTIRYEAEVNGMDLIFDSKGKFIKSMKN